MKDVAPHRARSARRRPDGPRPGPRRRRRRLPPVSVMPTLVTLGNLVAGFVAIAVTARPIETLGPWGTSSLTFAGMLVFLGMFLDAVDGSVARLTRSFSSLGAHLDSSADLVTFGIAPAFMVLRLVNEALAPGGTPVFSAELDLALSKVLWGIVIVYACCAALRLARFNVESPHAAGERHLVFRGLPSPGAAGAVASLIILHQHWLGQDSLTAARAEALARGMALCVPFVTLLCALAMVSSIPYVHFTNRYIAGRRSFAYLVRLVVPLLLLLVWVQETLAVAFTIYAVSGPLRVLMRRRPSTPPERGDSLSAS